MCVFVCCGVVLRRRGQRGADGVVSSFDALCRSHGLAGVCVLACCAGSGSSCWPPGTRDPGCTASTRSSQFR